jgi:hypothetical protein
MLEVNIRSQSMTFSVVDVSRFAKGVSSDFSVLNEQGFMHVGFLHRTRQIQDVWEQYHRLHSTIDHLDVFLNVLNLLDHRQSDR